MCTHALDNSAAAWCMGAQWYMQSPFLLSSSPLPHETGFTQHKACLSGLQSLHMTFIRDHLLMVWERKRHHTFLVDRGRPPHKIEPVFGTAVTMLQVVAGGRVTVPMRGGLHLWKWQVRATLGASLLALLLSGDEGEADPGIWGR